MTSQNTAQTNALWGECLVEELYRLGCRMFCISPGSRSTPLTAAVARQARCREDLQQRILPDERAAAFFALGYARVAQVPAVLICTSGTAVANYFPAVIEASIEQIPMIICSADRPSELLDTGANQTIHQNRIFGDYVRWFVDVHCSDMSVSVASLLTTLDQAYSRACFQHPGPVHLNLMFREPLIPAPDAYPLNTEGIPTRWKDSTQPYTRYIPTQSVPSVDSFESWAKILRESKRGLLVVGRLSPAVDVRSVLLLADTLQWPVFADIGSGLRHVAAEFDDRYVPWVDGVDAFFHNERMMQQLQPDTLLHIGGPLVSKGLSVWLQRRPRLTYLHMYDRPERMDPHHCVTERMDGSIAKLCRALQQAVEQKQPSAQEPQTQWRDLWMRCSRALSMLLREWMPRTVWHEPAVAHFLSQWIPSSHLVFLGNSMPIRDWDRFATRETKQTTFVANRGASGIDGLLATAMGAVQAYGQTGTLILGDISMLHDLNSLLWLQQSQIPLVVIVINNQGGSIFGILPIAQHQDIWRSHFLTPHTFSLATIAKSIGLSTFAPTHLEALSADYKTALSLGQPCLIEITTQREDNYRFYREISAQITERWESWIAVE